MKAVMNRTIMKTIIIALIALLIYSAPLHAYCEGGKYQNISVSEEIKKCDFIIIGTVVSRKIVVDPVEDPIGYEAEIFDVEVESILYGTPKEKLTKPSLSVYNENTSARYPMIVGEKYLLFVYLDNVGFWINSCGNSTLYKKSEEPIAEIKRNIGQNNRK